MTYRIVKFIRILAGEFVIFMLDRLLRRLRR